MMKHIVSLSGGKDSTAMLLMMIERNMPIDAIVYVDTTKDFPGMYEHLEKLGEHIKPFEITRLTFDFDYWFGEHEITRGKRKGNYGYGWPHSNRRWCTRMKIDLIKDFIGDQEAIEYIGLAADERHRMKNDKTKVYPLIEWGITEIQALAYCYDRGFDWGGLYEYFDRVSCYLCPLQSLSDFKAIYQHYPEQWQNIKEMDEKSYCWFHKYYTIEGLEHRFEIENQISKMQMRLFK
jgi:3'-phosphoadenosine 5'-phosphosulfate sulfotransferase (PAPS reductase)/FAD synthetase